jgi:hypothetical protein
LENGKDRPRPAHHHSVESLALSPDGRLLLSGSNDRKVGLWEVFTGQEILTFSKHQRAVDAVAFSPDGRLAASAGGELHVPYGVKEPRRIRIWEVAGGEEIATFGGHDSDVVALAFSPDGAKLVTALKNNTTLVWDLKGLKLPTRTPVPKTLEQLWADLAAGAPAAHAAIALLAEKREPAVAYLKDRLQPALPQDPQQIKKLVADLASDRFALREAATKQLLAFDPPPLSAIRQALGANPSLESRRRLEQILSQVEGPLVVDSETVRGARAVAVLEKVASPEARRILEKLAQGAPEARLTREAKASLARLARAPGDHFLR